MMVHPKNAWRTKQWDGSGVTSNQLQELGVSSIQELAAKKEARVAARKALSDYLARPDLSGQEKQHARCAYIHKYGRLPYQCSGCWLLPGHCVCGQLRKAQPATKVVIHLHQDEWGRGSNTGCLCASSLSGSQLLLRGHAPHDEQLAALLSDPGYTTALLWPGDDALEPQQLQELAAQRSNGRIALVAIDATWGCAVKMRRKYPEGVLTVRLPPDLALPQLHHLAAVGSDLQQQQQDAHLPDSIQQAGINGSSTSASGSPSASSSIQQAGATVTIARSPTSSSKQQDQPQLHSSSSDASGLRAGSTNGSSLKGPKHIPAPGERVSLFRGVRKYHGKAAENGRVSTLEAVAAALLALEGDETMHAGLLHNLVLKVDAMRRQKHVAPVTNGIAGLSLEEESEDERL